jgi:hypothetical protein
LLPNAMYPKRSTFSRTSSASCMTNNRRAVDRGVFRPGGMG